MLITETRQDKNRHRLLDMLFTNTSSNVSVIITIVVIIVIARYSLMSLMDAILRKLIERNENGGAWRTK